MPTTTRTDQLRIERVIWTLDAHVQSLPGRSRRAIRREMRANLRASAAEVGGREAIRRLGGVRPLAAGYLDVEYDGRPRPQVLKALFWTIGMELLILGAAAVGTGAFLAGIEAATPHVTGSYAWTGLSRLGIGTNASYTNGQLDSIGLSVNAWMPLYLVVAFLIGGRYWRSLTRRRRASR